MWSQWTRSGVAWGSCRPKKYPTFDEWHQGALKGVPPAAQRGSKPQAPKREHSAPPPDLLAALTRQYIEWEAFAFWARSIVESHEKYRRTLRAFSNTDVRVSLVTFKASARSPPSAPIGSGKSCWRGSKVISLWVRRKLPGLVLFAVVPEGTCAAKESPITGPCAVPSGRRAARLPTLASKSGSMKPMPSSRDSFTRRIPVDRGGATLNLDFSSGLHDEHLPCVRSLARNGASSASLPQGSRMESLQDVAGRANEAILR